MFPNEKKEEKDTETTMDKPVCKPQSLKFVEQNAFLSYLSKTCLVDEPFDASEALDVFITCLGEKYNTFELLRDNLGGIPHLNRVCGREIQPNEAYYRCLDCDLVNSHQCNAHALQCKDCFMKANHDGHRVTTQTSHDYIGTCDCGDANLWDSKGFCSLHSGLTKEMIDQASEKIPKQVRECYISSMKEILYSIFEFLQDNPQHENIVDATITVISQIHHINDCFKLLTCEVLNSKLTNDYKLRINLQNLVNFELKPEVQPCDCTYLELLIRYDFMFSETFQTAIHGLILELFVFPDFKETYMRLYTKQLHFFHYLGDYPGFPTQKISKNALLDYQFFSSEKFSVLAVSHPESTNFFEVACRLLKNYHQMPIRTFYLISFYGLGPAKYILGQQKASEVMLQRPEFTEKVLHILDLFRIFDSPLNLDELVKSLGSDSCLGKYENITFTFKEYLNLLQSFFACIFLLKDSSLQEKSISNVFKTFMALLEKEMDLNGPINVAILRLYPSIIVSFGDFLLLWFRHCTNLEDLKGRIDSELKSNGISKAKFELVSKYVFQSGLLLINYTCALQRIGDWAPNYKSFEEILNLYFESRMTKFSRIESALICLLQLLSNFDSKDAWISSLAENFLNISVSNHVVQREYIPYFFKTLHFVLTDQISFNNVILQQNGTKVKEWNQFDSILKSIEFKAVLSYLYIHNQESFQTIKDALESLLELKDAAIFQEITEFNHKTNKLKVKESFRNKEFDNGIFYLNVRLDNAFKSKLIEDAGSKTEYSDVKTDSLLAESHNPLVKKRYIEDAILWAIICTYRCAKKNAKNTHLLTPLFAFQIQCLEALPTNEAKAKIEKNLIGPDFEDEKIICKTRDLKTLKALQERYYSLRNDLENIFEILKKSDRGLYAKLIDNMISSFKRVLKRVYHFHGEELKSEGEEKNESQIPVENPDLNKERLLAKQKLIRDEYLRKQKRFLNNASITQIKQREESKETSEKSKDFGICVACREPLDEKEHNGYGLITFVSKSNLYQHCIAKKIKSKTYLGDGHLVMSTCKHSLHIDCYSKMKALHAGVEFKCPLCKMLANQLIYPIEETKPKSATVQQIEPKSLEFNLKELLKLFEICQQTQGKLGDHQSKQINMLEELFDEIKIHEILIAEEVELPEASQSDSFESLTNALLMTVLETELTGLQVFLQNQMTLYSIVAQGLKKYARLKAFNYKEKPKIIEFLGNMDDMNYFRANAETFILSSPLDIVKTVLAAFQSVADESFDIYSKFFFLMLNASLMLEFLKLFYEDMQSKCSGDTKEMASAFTFDNFKDSCADNLFCERPNITGLLRKFVALGLITGVYQYSPDSSSLLDTELSMLQFLLCKKEKKDLISLITSFLSQNKTFFENLLIELQMLDLKIEFEDSNLSGLVLVPLPKKYQEFNSNVSKGKCCSCNSISSRGIAQCLICGELYCIGPCDVNLPAQGEIGNLNTHSRNAHFGISVLIECKYARLLLVHSPRNISYGHLYLDNLGQEIDPVKSNWEDFMLSEYTYSKIKEMVILGRVPHEIYSQIEATEQRIQDNYL